MENKPIETSLSPEINIGQIEGNLQVRGWDRAEVVINAPPDNLDIEQGDDSMSITCHDNCVIHLPEGAALKISDVHGNANIRGLEEPLEIGNVHGNLNLRSVAGLKLGSVHGEFYAKYLAGDLLAGQIHGNAKARQVQGSCKLEEVAGNIDLRDIEYDVQVKADGNIRLRLGVMLGSEYRLQADGNVNCRLPVDADLQVKLASEAEVIKLRLPENSQTIQEASYELTLGEGRGIMQVESGGVIYLAGEDEWEPSWDASEAENYAELNLQIAEQVEAQIKAQMESVNRQINEQMSDLAHRVGQAGLSPEETERILEQARLVSERETARAQEKLRRAQEKLERRMEAAQRRRDLHNQRRHTMDVQIGKYKPKISWGAAKMVHNAPPEVSEEERLTILRMLEQKKISLDEAEQLLAALEGR